MVQHNPGMRASIAQGLGSGGRTIVLLGVVSLLTDVSSEMILNVLPIFLTGTLGVSVLAVGVIEGVGESTAATMRLIAGQLSDRLRRRTPIMFAGYGLSALTKPLFALVTGPGLAGLLRFMDRAGKARGPARDALIADAASEGARGAAFGLHRAMDTAGAVVGISLAALTVWVLGSDGLSRGDFQRLVLIASVPAFAGVLLLTRVRESPVARAEARTRSGWLTWPATATERRYLVAVLLFGLGNSSDAFVILRMIDVGAGIVGALLLLVVMNISHVLVAVPAGLLSDRTGRRSLLLGAYAAYALIYAAFAGLNDAWQFIPLLILYGAYYGVTEGVARAFVADLVPPQSRGAAFGWFYAATAIAALPASIVAGWLWTEFGPGATFVFGSACAVAATAALATVPVPVREETSGA